jgi:NitT/TauT family transport system permease protein
MASVRSAMHAGRLHFSGRFSRYVDVFLKHVVPNFVITLIYLGAVWLIWEGAILIFGIKPYILPRPSAVFDSLSKLPAYYLHHTLVTLEEAGVGVLIGFVSGLMLGIVIRYSGRIGRILNPVILATQVFPKEALAPVFLVFLGFGTLPKIIISALICFFPVVVNTAKGLAVTPSAFEQLMYILGASGWQLFWRCRLPFAAQYIFASLRICATLSVIGAVVGEFVGSTAGLGHVIRSASTDIGTDRIYAALLLLGLLGGFFYLIAVLIERVLFRKYTTIV